MHSVHHTSSRSLASLYIFVLHARARSRDLSLVHESPQLSVRLSQRSIIEGFSTKLRVRIIISSFSQYLLFYLKAKNDQREPRRPTIRRSRRRRKERIKRTKDKLAVWLVLSFDQSFVACFRTQSVGLPILIGSLVSIDVRFKPSRLLRIIIWKVLPLHLPQHAFSM